jgi:hypothetical protein
MKESILRVRKRGRMVELAYNIYAFPHFVMHVFTSGFVQVLVID